MKRFLTGLLISCLLAAALCTSAFAAAASGSSSAAASGSSSASSGSSSSSKSKTETEAPAKNLATDKVSAQDIAIYSKACCVLDAKTGQVLYYKNPGDRHYPASITKIMTALLLIENSKLDDKITFSEDCWAGIDRWSDMNVAMQDGEVLTVEQALYCMLLVSANEVCNQAAIKVSGSIAKFADLMNARANELGCTGTHFVTTNGLHNKDHYTTAHDMALISRAAILNDTFRKITGTSYYKVTTEKRPEGFDLYHKHRMLAATSWHDDRCIGGKTGYTPQANNTLVTYMKKDDVTLVCVVLDNSNGHIYSDTKSICDYCFSKYTRSSIDALAASDAGKALNAAAGGSAAVSATGSTEAAQSGAEEGQALHLKDSGGSAAISDFFSSPEALRDRAVNAFIKYIPYSFLILLAVFIVLTLIIIAVRGAVRRSIHRRRYKKMRRGGKSGRKNKKRRR